MLRRRSPLLAGLAGLAALAGAPLAQAQTGLVTRPAARVPLSDALAARLVHRSAWEPRTDNGATRDRMPTPAQLRRFWAQSPMPDAHWVTGHFTGTTDEILQWAAIKWGFSPDLLRAVAATESWLNTVSGDGAVYRPHDLWGSVGAWDSGRWRDPQALRYVAAVQANLRERVWRSADFAGGN